MSGLSRTPGKRVGVNSPPRVRIPLPPPATSPAQYSLDCGCAIRTQATSTRPWLGGRRAGAFSRLSSPTRASDAGQSSTWARQHQALDPKRRLGHRTEVARGLVAQADGDPARPPDHAACAWQHHRADVTRWNVHGRRRFVGANDRRALIGDEEGMGWIRHGKLPKKWQTNDCVLPAPPIAPTEGARLSVSILRISDAVTARP